MKKIYIFLITSLFLTITSVIYAQNDENSWFFTAGLNVVDIRVPSDFKGIVEDYLNGSIEDLNYYGIPLRFTVEKYIDRGLSVQLAGSMNKIKRGSHLHNGIGLTDSNFLLIDVKLKYALANIFDKEYGWFDPFVGTGVGFSFIGDYETVFPDISSGNDLKIGAGGGMNFWLSKSFGVGLESYYHHNFKNTFNDDTATGTDFFQHTISILYRPDTIDSDSDGIKDKNDICPTTFGIAEFNGCPPPDSDNDKVIDKEDDCPDVKGLVKFKGCPDTDADGIVDSEDKCPKYAGPKENKGCPWKDTDKDGVLDKDDDCPKVFGDSVNMGCPKKVIEVKPTTINKPVFNEIIIYFDIDSFILNNDQRIKLDKAIYRIKKPGRRFLVEGHTDSGGSSLYNQKLSDKRANAVKKYLLSKSVNSDMLSIIGLGENMPSSDNTTAIGRANNRRVKITLIE